MIKTKDIYKAIVEKLKEEFELPVYSSNTQEGFTPECFFVEVVAPRDTMAASGYRLDEITFRVTFIPTMYNFMAKVLNIEEALKESFQNLVVNDETITIIERSYNITSNNALEMLFAMTLYQQVETEQGPLMEEIMINEEVN